MIQEVAPRIQIEQNDGTNAADIVNTINAWRVAAPIPNFVSVTDNAGTVEVQQTMFGSPVVTMSIPPTGWIVLSGGSQISACTDSERTARYGAAL